MNILEEDKGGDMFSVVIEPANLNLIKTGHQQIRSKQGDC